jgi:hypothetical protein
LVFVELPVLGVLGEVVLGEVVLDEPLVLGEVVVLLLPDVLPELMLPEVLPDVPPELEPDLLKCASHSVRDTMPSLFVSTDEKLGAELLAEAPPLPDAPVAALPLDWDLPLDWELPLAPEELDCDCDGLVAELPPEDIEPLPEDDCEPVAAGDDEDGLLLDDDED